MHWNHKSFKFESDFKFTFSGRQLFTLSTEQCRILARVLGAHLVSMLGDASQFALQAVLFGGRAEL